MKTYHDKLNSQVVMINIITMIEKTFKILEMYKEGIDINGDELGELDPTEVEDNSTDPDTNHEQPDTSGQFTSEAEIYISNILPSIFAYHPSPNELNQVNDLVRSEGDSNPTAIIDLIKRIVEPDSDDGLRSELTSLDK